MKERDEIEKNLESIRKNLRVIKAEVIVFICLTSFLVGFLVGKLIS